MIIIQVAGGLGNQLQQYALYKKFLSLGTKASLDLAWFEAESRQNRVLAERELELAYFDHLTYEVCTPEDKAKLIGAEGTVGRIKRKLFPNSVHWFHETGIYHPELLEMKEMYLSGYFACEKYYADILPQLRREIRFPVSSNSENSRIAEEMQACESVSVHIRRGDYLDKENTAMFGNICTDAYYRGAFNYIKEYCRSPHFYFFSDDADYVRKKFIGDSYTTIDINHGKDSFYDMWLMSKCRHNICANSTFSFWGARLNPSKDKIMIRPTIHKNSQSFDREEMKELWQGWIFANPQGQIV